MTDVICPGISFLGAQVLRHDGKQGRLHQYQVRLQVEIPPIRRGSASKHQTHGKFALSIGQTEPFHMLTITLGLCAKFAHVLIDVNWRPYLYDIKGPQGLLGLSLAYTRIDDVGIIFPGVILVLMVGVWRLMVVVGERLWSQIGLTKYVA